MRKPAALLLAALSVGALLVLAKTSPAAPSGLKEFQKSGMSGSGAGVMTTMTLPASISRVAVRRDGSGEAWALGTSTARQSGWNPNGSPNGQVVFLRFLPQTGWSMMGPPRDAAGSIINPSLGDMAVAANGEGWAVGDQGTFLYHAPGSSSWVLHELPPEHRTTQLLQSVSLAVEGSSIVGWASGHGSVIYRYTQGGGWQLESPAPAMTADLSPGLFIAAISSEVAWAVSDGQRSDGVKIYSREVGGVWTRRIIGDPILDSPPATGKRGGYNARAWGSAIAADANTVWVGGGMQPSEAPFAPPNEQESDVTRPFLVEFDVSGAARNYYCPNLYRLRQSSDSPIDTTLLCQSPFPIAAYDIPSISIVGNQVFAGGQGLFHFDGTSWFREPNSNGYLVSVAMASFNDGWMATNGNLYLRGSTIASTSPYVGRWTSEQRAPKALVARWPQTQEHALESIAFSPDGKDAIAVGQQGAAIAFDPQVGWDERPPRASNALHGVAWPDRRPWVVGEGGFIGRYDPATRGWSFDEAYARFPTLFGVAFRSPNDGVAVGAGGAIVAYNGSGWRRVASPTDSTLYAVAATSGGYVAVGRDGTIVRSTGGSWSVDAEAKELLKASPYSSPSLYAVTALPDGRLLAGGQRGALLVGRPDGAFSLSDNVLQGTVLALGASRDGRLLASVTPDEFKFNATGALQAMRGSVLTLTSGGWQDISLNRRIRISNRHDSSSFDDPVLGFAMQDGSSGWAVGGSAAGVPDINPPEGHLRAAPNDSGSVYKIDFRSDPRPKDSQARVSLPQGVNFAVFGESWCGRPKTSATPSGLCSSAVGSGTQSDLVALRIRDEINRIAYPKNPDGPRFVLFTGNMRQTGVPEELAQFKSYLAGFDIPVYAAIGNTDLFQGLTGSAATVNNANTSGSNAYWKEAFGDMWKPWGRGTFPGMPATPGYIRPVDVSLPNAVIHPELARTHYAFDVMDKGIRALRVIVLDSSTKSYGSSTDQEPQLEGQSEWLQAVISDAKLLNVPIVISMNQPTVIPASVQIPNWNNQADKTTFESMVVSGGVSAVFAGGLRKNATDSYPQRRGVVPLYIMGGGGAPLGFEGTQPPVGPPTGPLVPASMLASDGYYHGWHLMSFNPDPGSRNILGQAPHSLKTFMSLEYLGIHAVDGDTVKAGNAVRFSGFGRQMTGGWSVPEQARSSTFQLGFPFAPECANAGDGDIYCQSVNAIAPPYRLSSENPKIARFVVPSPVAGYTTPFIHPITGTMIEDRDGRFGYLCTFDKGTVGINLESGTINRRIVVTVLPGDGPCVKFPVLPDPTIPPIFRLQPVDPPAEESTPTVPRFNPPPFPETLAVILPPAPGPIAAPAPPASAATSRKEEEEHQTQTEGQEGDGESNFMAISHQREVRRYDNAIAMAALVMSTVMGAGFAFALAAHRRRKIFRPEYVAWRSR